MRRGVAFIEQDEGKNEVAVTTKLFASDVFRSLNCIPAGGAGGCSATNKYIYSWMYMTYVVYQMPEPAMQGCRAHHVEGVNACSHFGRIGRHRVTVRMIAIYITAGKAGEFRRIWKTAESYKRQILLNSNVS